MRESFELSVEVSELYDFNQQALQKIEQNVWVKNQWPLVYFIRNDNTKVAYVGESTNAASRIKNHLSNPERCKLTKISIIGSDKFNKSATLDIESNLIQYITSDGSYKLQNGNYGLVNHNYYQQDLYKNLFREIWKKLIERKIVSKSLSEIENSEVFKYSPFKSLNEDQYKSVIDILSVLTSRENNQIFVSGGAGTGKTVLATYLIKLLVSDIDLSRVDEFSDDELREINYIRAFRTKYPQAKIGLVIAMTSLRLTLQSVFRKIPGLKPSMILSPSDTLKSKTKYDLLIVDEAHRLRKYKNISWMGAFRTNNLKLGLDDNGTELDWILAMSKNQIFFYDAAQSVKPSDVDASRFSKLLDERSAVKFALSSQMRVRGGNNYIQFVDELLHVKKAGNVKFSMDKYELYMFDSFADLHAELVKREDQYGLCRMIAGFAWPWLSDQRIKPKPSTDTTDIELDSMKFKWNATDKDWINTPNAFNEIGCIHTTQGYDLNYAAVIFGKEIDYNTQTNCIEIETRHYHDKNGKKGISDPEELKAYIINIYKTLMYRGIKGTFVYACNTGLREYFNKHIPSFKKKYPFRVIPVTDVKPYVNSIPLLDITVAAGQFSGWQKYEEFTWIEPPSHISAKPEYFVCQVKGESMNKVIPNGAFCLFKKYEGGSREGKIVLVRATSIQDAEFGSGYTIKEYHSIKRNTQESWEHEAIHLKPLSDQPYDTIRLYPDEMTEFDVIGVFDRVLV